jgi:hypothetical protein
MAAITNVLARIAGRSLFPGRSANVSLHTRLAARVVEDLSRHLQRSCHLDDIHLTRTGSLIVRIHADRSYVAKLPLYATTEPRLRRSADALTRLAQAEWMTPFLAGRCPAIVLSGKASGSFYSIETAVPGQDGASILKTGGTADEMILSAERFLSKLQKASANRQSPGWQEHLGRAVTRVSGLAARAGVERAYTTLIADLRTRLSVRPLRAVAKERDHLIDGQPAIREGIRELVERDLQRAALCFQAVFRWYFFNTSQPATAPGTVTVWIPVGGIESMPL